MYNCIVIAIDMSHTEKADAMVEAARKLLSDDGSVVFANIVEELPAHISSEFPGRYLDQSKTASRAKLEEIAQTCELKSEVDVRVGHAHTSILALAKEKSADAIIVASHKPGLPDYFLGSTASRVVRHATCSVLVLR